MGSDATKLTSDATKTISMPTAGGMDVKWYMTGSRCLMDGAGYKNQYVMTLMHGTVMEIK